MNFIYLNEKIGGLVQLQKKYDKCLRDNPPQYNIENNVLTGENQVDLRTYLLWSTLPKIMKYSVSLAFSFSME